MAKIDIKKETAVPPTPPTGYIRFFPENSQLRYVDDTGSVYTLAVGITQEDIEDIVGNLISAGSGITINYDDPSDNLTISVDGSTLALISSAIQPADLSTVATTGDYDDLVNKPSLDFVPLTRNINTGSGLNGGGQLNADRTINLDTQSLTAGSYTNVDLTVNSKGIITSISNGGGGSIFGSNWQLEESDGLSSTTSTTYQNKLNLTTSSLPLGTYRVGWTYSWSHGSTGSDFEARIQQNNTTTLMSHAQEPKDSGTDQLHRHSGFEYLESISGVQSFDLDYRTDSGGDTAYIQRARLEFWRIS